MGLRTIPHLLGQLPGLPEGSRSPESRASSPLRALARRLLPGERGGSRGRARQCPGKRLSWLTTPSSHVLRPFPGKAPAAESG